MQRQNSGFHLNGTAEKASPDTIAPKVVAYLNEVETPEYGVVGRTPTLIADISDDSGINTAGTSIGHDIELTLDDDLSSTVSLNEHSLTLPVPTTADNSSTASRLSRRDSTR